MGIKVEMLKIGMEMKNGEGGQGYYRLLKV